jgi:hypothetical protein
VWSAVILYILLTHQPPPEVQAHLEHFERVLPGRRTVVCYGGAPDDFDDLTVSSETLFVDDPALRRRGPGQSFTRVLTLVHERLVAPDPAYSCVHLVEWDHVVLSPRYEDELLQIMSDERVGLLARSCADHTFVNWCHSIDLLDDPRLVARLQEISVRDQVAPSVWGALGTSMTIRREALEKFASRAGDLSGYQESYIPSVVYHLGYRVTGAPEGSTLFDHLRYGPAYGMEEATALARQGALALHPVKDPAVREAVVGGPPPRALPPAPNPPPPAAP